MIEYLWELWRELWEYLSANFDPFRDTIDIVLVALGIYWLLMLMRGTRAVQILVGLIVLVVANVAADLFNLLTMRLILEKLSGPAVIIIVILFSRTSAARSRAWVVVSSGRSPISRNPKCSKRWSGPRRGSRSGGWER